MGSFSWLKADTLTSTANIVYGEPFKFLIPKEFDTEAVGFILDNYRDYGYLGEPTPEQLADVSIPEYEKIGRYDMYELLAVWNSDVTISEDITVRYFSDKEDIVIPKGTKVGDVLRGINFDNPMKEIDANTDFNRQIGVGIGCWDKDIDKLPYPLKLVSKDYTRSYEECVGRSYGDRNQGTKMTRASLYKGGLFYSSLRYDGTPWKEVHSEWRKAEKYLDQKSDFQINNH